MIERSNIEAILERQARWWELRRRLAQQGGEPARQAYAHLHEGPWISISRQLGCGGRRLAARLGERLGWEVLDREILKAIAENTRTREEVLRHLDERAIGPIQDYLARTLVAEVPGRVPFMQEMVRVIWGAAKKGNAIILGRGANWFLDPRFGLRLRVVAPLEARIAHLVAAEGLDPEAAARRIRDNDESQAGFIRLTYAREIDDPTGYDLVLNLGTVELLDAAQVLEDALRRKLDRVE